MNGESISTLLYVRAKWAVTKGSSEHNLMTRSIVRRVSETAKWTIMMRRTVLYNHLCIQASMVASGHRQQLRCVQLLLGRGWIHSGPPSPPMMDSNQTDEGIDSDASSSFTTEDSFPAPKRKKAVHNSDTNIQTKEQESRNVREKKKTLLSTLKWESPFEFGNLHRKHKATHSGEQKKTNRWRIPASEMTNR
ncbi:hypothetical protein CEXT_67531 [Caerostris extrusa]|uniref:Uncharacterized protein n=1 Tax=Caerostris extrusa TaxID=172846 RepID=A0AAV4XS20_CAEEX|nr:hypothetical protein CEXT_67531 [Caerostris extrusa]